MCSLEYRAIVSVAHITARIPSTLLAAIADPIIAGGFHSTGASTALRALVGERFAPRLASYPGPVLIVNGELDVLFRLGARRFAAAARDARRVRLRGATHLANLDRPDAFNEAVRRFMTGLQGRP